MAEYPDTTKLSIGDLVLQIGDLEDELDKVRHKGYALVAPLRAIADLFDSNQSRPENIVWASDTHFATTHRSQRPSEKIIIDGESYTAFTYPKDVRDILQKTFETEQELRRLEKALENAKQRARKVIF